MSFGSQCKLLLYGDVIDGLIVALLKNGVFTAIFSISSPEMPDFGALVPPPDIWANSGDFMKNGASQRSLESSLRLLR